jgi:hypothetical protein
MDPSIVIGVGTRARIDYAGGLARGYGGAVALAEIVPTVNGWVIVTYTGATLFVPHPTSG